MSDALGSDLSPDPWGETVEHLTERAKVCIESGDPLFVVDARFVLSLVAFAKDSGLDAKDAKMRAWAMTDYFADASRRADEWQERAERAERQISLRERLAELLALKDRKDTIGKDIEYLRRQPLAWEAARDALADLDTKEGT